METNQGQSPEFLGTFKLHDAQIIDERFHKANIKFEWKDGDSGLVDLPLQQEDPDTLLRLCVHNSDIEKASKNLADLFGEPL